jgi:hypothetical protein
MKRLALLLPVAVLIAACSSDATTEPEANLTTEEISQAFEALSNVGGLTLGFLPIGLRDAALMASLTESIDETESCPRGGSTRYRGTVTVNESSGSGSLDIRQTYSNCASDSDNGRVWTFNGDPDVRTRITAGVSASTQQLSITGTQQGAFRFSSDGNSGRCSVDLRLTFTETTYSVTGKICGRPYSESGRFEL